MRGFIKALALCIAFAGILAGLTLGIRRFTGEWHISRLTDERISFTQNKIPPEVLTWARDQERILGLQYPTNRPLYILPKSVRVPILMYHYVENVKDERDTIRKSLATTPYTLEQEIITLRDAGYTFLTNNELAQILDGKKRLPEKAVLLTFDDGYRDFYTDAYPILRKYQVHATSYVIAGFIGAPNSMTENQIKEIAGEGLVEIGAHTVRHAHLKGIGLKTLQHEITEGKRILEEIIGIPVVSFAYPYGVFDLPAIEAVHQAGFTSAVSIIPGIEQLQSHRYFLYRLRPGGRTGESLLTWLANVKDEEISFMSKDAGSVSSNQ